MGTDQYSSMKNGPVLRRVFDLLSEEPAPDTKSYWNRYISTTNYDVKLEQRPPARELSEAEEALLDEIYGRLGHKSRWDLVEMTHQLPEWTDPQGSALPIEYRDILRAGGKTDIEVAEIEDELSSLVAAEALAGPV